MSVKLPGYQIKQKLYEGTRTLVYRGIRETDSQTVVLKFLRNEYPTFNELLHFRNQYTITKNLNLPGVVKSLSLETYRNGYALVMEDTGAISLDKYDSLDLTSCLKIGIQLAEILHKLYQNRIIHKDIKPANILIHPQTQQVKLIDFSIASVLPFETTEIQNPNILEGTLAYISPEQTGRMNRGIDYRSDFYCLGVSLYELLSGELPFTSDDAMELVHCHISRQPPPLKTEIPQVVSDIVMKLMAKNAEERYQNALGLKFDLEKCLSQWEEVGKIETFELGERDVSDRFLIPEKLYGRESEVQSLLDAFERVAGGKTEVMLVAGFSGIGKTAVINEVHKPIVRQRGYFIKGKFDQFNRNIPFSAFVQAFRDLMGQLLGESDTQLERWKSKILYALGENAQIIIDVIPELERLIGQQPAVTELSGSAAQNRFNLLFGKFVQIFTTKDHPLVLFLDDLQWVDSASLNLLTLLMGEMETGHLLVLGAYRDNEIFPAHPLMLALDEIVKNQAILNTITLEPLNESGLNHLIADTLNCSYKLAFPLTELVYQKTKGNPFFATQFLKALNEGEWISYNPELGYWQCDLLSVKQLALTDDVVEFMATQLQKLSQETQEILKLAACIGNKFDLATLAIVSEQAETKTATALWKALQEGLVLPSNELYKFYQSEENTESLSNIKEQSPSYRFLHDRVQQASYSLIPEDRKEATHLKIGRLLLQNTLPQEQEEKNFEIVNHLNKGISLLGDRVERNQLSELNLLAGRKAKVSTAYEVADNYFNVGIELLDDCAWEESYNLTLQFYECRAEVEYLNGDFEKSENDARVIIKKANNDIDRAKIYNLLVIQYTTMGQFSEAIEAGREGLRLLGIQFPKENFHQAIEIEQAWIKKELETRKIADFVDALEIESDRQKVAVKLLASMQPTGYFYNPDIWALSVVKCVHLLIEYGYTDEAPFGYTNYGLFLTVTLEQYKTGYEFGCVGVQLVDKFHNLPQKSQVYCPFGMCLSPWVESSKISQDFAMQAYYAGLEAGNLQWAGYSLGYRLFMLVFNGNNLQELLKEVEICFLFGKKQQNQVVVDMAISCHVILSQLSNDRDQKMGSKIDLIEESEILEHSTSIPQYLILKSQLCYLQEQIEAALHYSLQAKEVVNLIQGNIPVVEYNFYYSLILLALHHQKSVEEKQNDWEQLIANQKQMKKWSDNCPENFLHRYLLVEAEMARLSDDKLKSIEMYDRAIAGAKEYKFIQNEALANELAAKFYLDWGKEKVAAGYMQEAYYCYARWGAKAKTDDLEQRYPQLLQPIFQSTVLSSNWLDTLSNIAPTRASVNSTLTVNSISGGNINTALDFASVLKYSQAISDIIQLDELLRQLTRILLQTSGGDRCVIVLPDENGNWQVSTIATIDTIELCAEPLANSPNAPTQLINYVKNTQMVVAIDNLATELPIVDTYLTQHQPQSFVCLPMLHHDTIVGVLYLHNQFTRGIFTKDRILVLNFLCTQAAISIQNSTLYRNLERSLQDARQKSQDLAEIVALSNEQQRILAFIAQRVPLNTILEETALHIESQSHHPAYCSFLRLDSEGRLRHLAAPSLPEAYNTLIDGLEIGPEVGSCGTAAYKKASVTVEDITTDPLWANFQIALKHGLRACASTPILGSKGEVLATLAMYQPKPGKFTIHDRKLMEVATYLARIAIERHQADIELQKLNFQIIQGEKLASLGNMIAGVAHEINNPLGFISGSIGNGKEYVQDLLGHLALYQQHYPEPVDAIQDNAEDIDLEFIVEDLPKLMNSVQSATFQIKDISTSLRIFSRGDKKHKVSANLHKSLDSTLLILKYRLKANEKRSGIEVIQDYGKLPEIYCFPGQLNQVFMNILANAIDAFDEAGQTKDKPQTIAIKTVLTQQNTIEIRIRDNGKGMSSDVKAQIFEHLFTTKGVGKGTGLGLSISRQIVEEKHGGKLTCNSAPGKGTEFVIALPSQ